MASSTSTKSSSTVVSAKMLPNFWFTADNDANYLMGFLDARKKAQTGGDKDQTQFREAIRYYEPFVRKHSENILGLSATILTNLCMSFIMISKNEDAEKVMRTIQKAEEQLASKGPDKKCYHLCIVNLIIGTIYCAMGNCEFGISRIIKSLEPYDKKLGTDTWFHAKRCFAALAEAVVKKMVTLKDSSYVKIISFLDAAGTHGKGIQTRSQTGVEMDATADPVKKMNHTVTSEARVLKKLYLKMQESDYHS